MEAFIGLILIITVVAFLFFFKGMIKKSGQYADDVVTTNITENSVNLIKRSTKVAQQLAEEFPDGFETPQEIYDRLMNTRKVVNKG